ncbi:MAG: hypothetical protein QF365_01480 [Candidatus Thalassarchaeaceae archaeon]|nr:hypothetical protein [Candidatus Thalassarchaeaceae archaeon]
MAPDAGIRFISEGVFRLLLKTLSNLKYRIFGWLIFGTNRANRALQKENKTLKNKVSSLEKKIHYMNRDYSIESNELKMEVVEAKISITMWRERHDELSRQRRGHKEEWEEEVLSPLVAEINLLKEEITSLEDIIQKMTGYEGEGKDESAIASVSDALELAEIECGNLVVFSDAKKSAKDCIYDDPDRVLDVLRTVDQCATEWFETPEGSGSLEERLRISGLNIAAGESKTALGAHPRVFNNQSSSDFRTEQMLNHIRLGVSHNQERTMRIHYSASREIREVAIGYCGKHLPIR